MRWCRHETQQQKKQRKIKYWLCKSIGINRNLSYSLRDWNFKPLQNFLLQNYLIKKLFEEYQNE